MERVNHMEEKEKNVLKQAKKAQKVKTLASGKRTSIVNEVLLVIVPVIAIAIVFSILFLSYNAQNIIDEQAEYSLQQETEDHSEAIALQIDKVLYKVAGRLDLISKSTYKTDEDISTAMGSFPMATAVSMARMSVTIRTMLSSRRLQRQLVRTAQIL